MAIKEFTGELDEAPSSGGVKKFQGELDPPKQKKGWADSLNPTLRKTVQIGLPIAGAVAGGALAAPFTGGLSTVAAMGLLGAAEGIGSMGGEALNQATGISEHSPDELKMAMAAPVGGRYAIGALESVPRWLPGFGTALKAALTPEARELPGKLLGGGPSSKQLYSQLSQQTGPNLRITDLPNLSAAVKELETNITHIPWENLQGKLKATGQSELFDQIKQTIQGVAPTVGLTKPTVGGKPFNLSGFPSTMQVTNQGRPAGLSFEESKAAIEGLGAAIRSTTDGAERGAYKKLYGALLDDLEKAPKPASGDIRLWQQAQKAYKREKAQFLLQEQTEKTIATKEGIDVFNPDAMVKWLRTAGKEEITKRVGAQEYRDILNEYRYMSAVAGHNMPKFFAMAAGGTLGSIMGGAGWGVGGATAGLTAAEGLSRLMMTERGRMIVRKLASDPRQSVARKIGAAAGAGAAGMMNQGEEDE